MDDILIKFGQRRFSADSPLADTEGLAKFIAIYTVSPSKVNAYQHINELKQVDLTTLADTDMKKKKTL